MRRHESLSHKEKEKMKMEINQAVDFVKQSFRNEIGRHAFKQGFTSKTNLMLTGIGSIICLTILANIDKKYAKKDFDIEWDDRTMQVKWEGAETVVKED